MDAGFPVAFDNRMVLRLDWFEVDGSAGTSVISFLRFVITPESVWTSFRDPVSHIASNTPYYFVYIEMLFACCLDPLPGFLRYLCCFQGLHFPGTEYSVYLATI